MLTVVGNTTVDIIVRGLAQLPSLSGNGVSDAALVQTRERVVPTLGGNGACASYASAALGELVRLWSALGSDSFGELALNWLEGRKVDTASVRIMGEAGTSTNVVLKSEERQQQTLRYPGASGIFVPRARAVSGGLTDWLLIAGYTQLPGWRGENTLEVLRNARKGGINTAFDMGPPGSEAITSVEIEMLLPHVGLLLCDALPFEQATGRAIREGARWAIEEGAGAVVLRIEGKGALVFDDRASDGLEVPAFEAEEVSEASASDGFNAGFLYERSRGASLEQSTRFANATAALIMRAARGILDAPDEAAVRGLLKRET